MLKLRPSGGGGIATSTVRQSRDFGRWLGAGGQRTPHYLRTFARAARNLLLLKDLTMEAGGIEPPGKSSFKANTPYFAPIADRLVTYRGIKVFEGTEKDKSSRHSSRGNTRIGRLLLAARYSGKSAACIIDTAKRRKRRFAEVDSLANTKVARTHIGSTRFGTTSRQVFQR